MRSIWVGIHPCRTGTRVIAMDGPTETLLKARLPLPRHPRAVAMLLEALALWHGTQVRAAVAADETLAMSGTSLSPDLLGEVNGGPLYTLEYVPVHSRRRRRDGLDGLGDFRDLRQLLLFEVAR